jgi:predicted 3-demethylubiquinone-9 3-methyltransferase (glyoxalase superfamily)
MQKIIPFLWFDNQAEEAANFYMSLFENSRVLEVSRYNEATPERAGQPLVVSFELEGQRFAALNGGPHFKFTPAISLYVTLETETEVDRVWEKLLGGGSVMMPLQKYDWSEKYGWLQDRYGLSWQIALGKREGTQAIVPALLFGEKQQHGKAKEAVKLYTSLFDSTVQHIMHAPKDEKQTKDLVLHGQFQLAGQTFTAMDSPSEHAFTFSEAFSLQVNCDNQEEVDKLWNALSAHPQAEQCGWLKDKFGVSWQVVPTVLFKLLQNSDKGKAKRVTEAMLKMKKLEIAALQQAAG